MYVIVSGLIFIAAILLILIVLVQNSKGGGLASNFASSNQVLGVRKTTDFLEKATWSLAIGLVVLSIMASAMIPRNELVEERSRLENVDFNDRANQNFPTTLPEETPVPVGDQPFQPTDGNE
jgi:preprotein translocase subunit SecG